MTSKWAIRGVALAVICAALASGGYLYLPYAQLDDLAQRTRDRLIYVPGAEFMAGNYETGIKLLDGTVERRWVKEPQLVLAPYPVTLDSFYLQDREATNADFALFLKDTGRPTLQVNAAYDIGTPDKAAVLAWHEAEAYCAWLGDLAGVPMRLATEAEWEFAARSRVYSAPWATSDGEFRKGVNIRASDPGENNPPAASFPPNPLGFYNMADGVYEWVSDRAATDPDTVQIAKGGSNFSSAFFETIPSRMVDEGTETLIPGLPAADRILHDAPDLIHYAKAGARCAASENRPPDQAGFGKVPDLDAVSLPDVYGPYDQNQMLR